MVEQNELFGKTFDQQHSIAGDNITDVDISPNKRINGEIIFEPVMNGVRVTARNDQHQILWGFIGSEGIVKQHPCPVALYDRLKDYINEELEKYNLTTSNNTDSIKSATDALDSLQKTIDELRNSLDVKKASDKTANRAILVSQAVGNADKMIRLETSSIRSKK